MLQRPTQGRVTPAHAVRVHKCICVLCWNLKGRIETMLVLMLHSRSPQHQSLAVLYSGHQVRIIPGDARKRDLKSNHLGTKDKD